MTATNHIERELEAVGDDVLGDIPADQRAVLAIQLLAAGDWDKANRLKETAPTKQYTAPDLEFTDRVTRQMLLAVTAMWELESSAWRFYYELTSGRLKSAHYRLYPDAEWTEEPSPDTDFFERLAADAAARFYSNYLAWERYATEVLGVSLEEFLSHPFGGKVSSRIAMIKQTAMTVSAEEVLEEHVEKLDDPPEKVGWAAQGTVTFEGEEYSAEELAERKFELIGESPPAEGWP